MHSLVHSYDFVARALSPSTEISGETWYRQERETLKIRALLHYVEIQSAAGSAHSKDAHNRAS